MSPLRDVAATTGMGGGGVAAALVLFGHREYAIKPSTRRRHSDSHSQRRRAPGRAPWAGTGLTVSDGVFGLSIIYADRTNVPRKSAELAGSQPPRYSTWA